MIIFTGLAEAAMSDGPAEGGGRDVITGTDEHQKNHVLSAQATRIRKQEWQCGTIRIWFSECGLSSGGSRRLVL